MKPLSNTTRSTLFVLSIIAFVIGTPVLIGYSKGYRLGDALELVQTGGIYIHSDVANANVYIDGDFIERNGPFLRNTFVQTLKPNRTYEVVVQKEGLQDYRKRLPVYPDLVTEARVFMLPATFEWREIVATSSVPTATRSTATTTRATTTREVPNPEFENLVEEFANDLDPFEVEVASTTVVTVRGREVATTTTIIERDFPSWLETVASTSGFYDKDMVRERDGIVTWLDSGNLFVLWVRESDPPPYYFCLRACKESLLIDWAEPIVRYDFFPNRDDVVVLLTARGIFAVELDDRTQRNIQIIREGANLDFRLDGDEITIFDGEVFLETRL